MPALFQVAWLFQGILLTILRISFTPSILAEHALSISEGSEHISCKILDRDEIRQMGMGGLSAVSFGSSEPPRFIHLSYSPPVKSRKKVAIVGKGITFDSGGLCLKPADSMRTMKMDMAGAAVVLGTMKALGELTPSVNVHGIVPATENMTGASAYKPDDVVTALNGKDNRNYKHRRGGQGGAF